MQKVIITGASGFIGKALTKKLLDEGITVYAVVRNKLKLTDFAHYDNLKIIECEMNNYKTLNEKILDKNFDVFFHLAWDGVFGNEFLNYDKQLKNVIFTCDAFNNAILLNCKKFIFMSTVGRYEVCEYINKNMLNLRISAIYGMSKLTAEIILKTLANKNKNIQLNVICPAIVYGENNNSKMLPNILIENFIQNNVPKLVYGNFLYDWIYVNDVIDGCINVDKLGKNGKTYYLGHRNLKTFKNIVIEVKNIIAPNLKLKFGDYPDGDLIDYSKIDLEACYIDTGFEAKADFKESILKTAEWIKNKDKSVVGG